MLAELHRRIRHARHGNVVDILKIAQHQIVGFEFLERRAHAAAGIGLARRFPSAHPRQFVNRIDNLHVAGAAAEMPPQLVRNFLARRAGILFDQCMPAHRHAGNAKTALHAAAPRERFGNLLPPLLGQTFQRHQRLACHLAGLHGARKLRRPVDQQRATPARCLRFAAVFERYAAEIFPQHCQERPPIVRRPLDFAAVERNRGASSLAFISNGDRHATTQTRPIIATVSSRLNPYMVILSYTYLFRS